MAEDEVASLGHLVAALTVDGDDVASLARVLTGALADALPADVVEVEYERSMSDRLHGRAGEPKSVTVTLGETVLKMAQDGRGRPQPQVARSVRGVILSRKPVTVAEWVEQLAQAVQAIAREDAHAREVLTRLLLG